ncbi:MAG: protein kinase [Sandaracinaceae bacterium]|nr:protein kinase [Sandaracinaceae bacterium]
MAEGADDETQAADGLEPEGIAPDLAPGDLIAGRYHIEAQIGRGGMGTVYRAHDATLDERVALKLLTRVSARSAERFVREVRVARKVTHPNVARTHDLGEHRGLPFLTMELVEGEALDDVLEARGRLPPDEVRRIGAAIAAGLEAAHAAGVVHRDLKPANVILARDGRVVLTDFGIARMASTAGGHTGGLIGTPHYMAPEQVAGRPAEPASDLYALGVVLFEMATGALPFDGDTPIAVAVARLASPPRDPRALAPLPDTLATLILQLLGREPAQRPASAAQVRAALEATGAPRHATPTTPPSLYAPMELGARALAILPFAYRGAPEHDYLGDGLSEELVDVLSRTRGLKLLALGATRRFAERRDPKEVHDALGVDAVVDGTVQLAGDRVRLAARLVEPSGVQLWSERFEGRFEDVFALQESMARRLAEALRLELTAASHRHSAPAEALTLYLEARRDLRTDVLMNAGGTVDKLERALALAPGFTPAIAAYAIACIRAWWGGAQSLDEGARGERARRAVERASREAPDVAETHLARAMYAVQGGDYRAAALACAEAIAIAPTMPEAHQYLAELQLEAGRLREGRERLALALSLDPTLNACHLALARSAALEGDRETMERHADVLLGLVDPSALPVLVARLRWALFLDDHAFARELLGGLEALGRRAAPAVALYRYALGEPLADAARQGLEELDAAAPNPRFRSLMLQIVVECAAVAGDVELALDALERAAAGVLVDVHWLDRCRQLAPLRASPRFEAARHTVAVRAAEVWRR